MIVSADITDIVKTALSAMSNIPPPEKSIKVKILPRNTMPAALDATAKKAETGVGAP